MEPSRTAPGHRAPDVDQAARAPLSGAVGPILVRSLGTYLVASVMFLTFVESQQATDHALGWGPWVTAVALTGVFCAAWVARDVMTSTLPRLTCVWTVTLVSVAFLLAGSALATSTERSRADGLDVASALGTSALVGIGLAVAVGFGVLCGRANLRSAGRAAGSVGSTSEE